MKYLFALTAIVFLLINKPGIGQTIKINGDKSKSTISYDMVHPLHHLASGVIRLVRAIDHFIPHGVRDLGDGIRRQFRAADGV